MKKLRTSILALFPLVLSLFCVVKAEDTVTQVIGPFGTLNNYDSSIIIPSGKAQDLLNVDITPGGSSVKKRKGYSLTNTLAITTSAVHGTYLFSDSSGNEYQLFFNDTRMSVSKNGASPTVLMSSGTKDAIYQCVDYAGNAYCGNTYNDFLLKTNGMTFSRMNTIVSTGSILAVTPDRLCMAGFSDAPNRIDFSASGDFTRWVQPFSLSTDPNEITILAPGSKITHLAYAFNRLIWFKDNSFGYILFDNTSLSNWTLRVISPTIGTLDNSSIYWQGILYFRSQEGHFYSFDGSNLQRMSRDITTSVNQAQFRKNNSMIIDTQADFTAGTSTPTVYADTATQAGFFQMTFPETFTTFRDGTNGTKAVWATPTCFGASAPNCSYGISAGLLNMTLQNAQVTIMMNSAFPSTAFAVGTTYYLTINSLSSTIISNTGSSQYSPEYDILPSLRSSSGVREFDFIIASTTSGKAYLQYGKATGFQCGNNSWNTPALFSSCGGDVALPAHFSIWVATTSITLKLFNDNGGYSSTNTGTHSATNSPEYFYLGAEMRVSNSAKAVSVDDFSILPETATFYSAVTNAPNITSWNTFSPTYSNSATGTNTFYLRTSNSSFLPSSTLPAWTAVTPGTILTASTGTYIQLRDDLAVGNSTDVPSVDVLKQQWFEGSPTDKAYAKYFDYALWWTVTYGTSTYNNRVFKYDLINNGWVIYDVPMNAPFIRNNSLYFGDPQYGYIYKFGDVDADNGAAINSYWRSKEFIGDSPFTDKSFVELSAKATSISGSISTITFTVDGVIASSNTWTTYKANSGFVKYNRGLPLSAIGSTFNFMFGNSAANQPWELIAGGISYRPKPIKDTNQ